MRIPLALVVRGCGGVGSDSGPAPFRHRARIASGRYTLGKDSITPISLEPPESAAGIADTSAKQLRVFLLDETHVARGSGQFLDTLG